MKTWAISEEEFKERVRQHNLENGNSNIPLKIVSSEKVSEKPSSRIKLIPFDEIKLGTEPRYLVKGIIPREGLVVVWGPPKCGKSFWTFDVAMHVSLNWL